MEASTLIEASTEFCNPNPAAQEREIVNLAAVISPLLPPESTAQGAKLLVHVS